MKKSSSGIQNHKKSRGELEEKPGEDFGKFKPQTPSSIAHFPRWNKQRKKASTGFYPYFDFYDFAHSRILK